MEVNFSPVSGGRMLRAKKRYAVPLCPLLEVTWWRAIFDEAQKVRLRGHRRLTELCAADPVLAWVCRIRSPHTAAQVSSGLSNVGVMARRLVSVHRWCVTGTPIGLGGLRDVQGLLGVRTLVACSR